MMWRGFLTWLGMGVAAVRPTHAAAHLADTLDRHASALRHVEARALLSVERAAADPLRDEMRGLDAERENEINALLQSMKAPRPLDAIDDAFRKRRR